MYWLKDKTGREFYETWENDIWIRKQIFYRKFVLSSASHKADQPNTHRRNHKKGSCKLKFFPFFRSWKRRFFNKLPVQTSESIED